MSDGIRGIGGLKSSAIEAALARKAELLRGLQSQSSALEGTSSSTASAVDTKSFADALKSGVQELDQEVRRSDELTSGVLNGTVEFHEVAAQLRTSQLAFDFSMQVRNKFVDAYREVMRMNV